MNGLMGDNPDRDQMLMLAKSRSLALHRWVWVDVSRPAVMRSIWSLSLVELPPGVGHRWRLAVPGRAL